LIEELGDLLYQVEFHATIAEQEGRFTIADVARATHDKLVRRHPHVFGDVQAETASDVVSTWDDIKRSERASKSQTRVDQPSDFFAGVARSAPSLSFAQKLQKRAAEVGFDWPNVDGASDKLQEEIGELRSAVSTEGDPAAIRMELGDVLFSVVNVARKLGVDAETALRDASDKFVARFTRVQQLAMDQGLSLEQCDLAQLDALWDEAKRAS
jgi:tetrapyrrole methylase family protein/MazG family protein